MPSREATPIGISESRKTDARVGSREIPHTYGQSAPLLCRALHIFRTGLPLIPRDLGPREHRWTGLADTWSTLTRGSAAALPSAGGGSRLPRPPQDPALMGGRRLRRGCCPGLGWTPTAGVGRITG